MNWENANVEEGLEAAEEQRLFDERAQSLHSSLYRNSRDLDTYDYLMQNVLDEVNVFIKTAHNDFLKGNLQEDFDCSDASIVLTQCIKDLICDPQIISVTDRAHLLKGSINALQEAHDELLGHNSEKGAPK